MRTDQNTRASFQRLDQPTDPEPAFAAKLRAQFLSTSATSGAPTAVPLHPMAIRTAPMRRRTRWLDLAAAAVLLLALSGGLLTLAPIQTEQRPATIQAPISEQPAVMQGGTAAQDNQYPGPNPATGKYEIASTFEPSMPSTQGPALVYGGRAYVLTMSNSGPFVTTLDAIDIATGKSTWQRELVLNGRFAVTPRGVVATVPVTDIATPIAKYGEPPVSSPYHVALLSAETGDAIWESPERYGAFDLHSAPTVLVAQQRIFVLDGLGTVFALDLNSGDEIWRHSYDRTPAPGLNQQICPPNVPPPGDCWPRSDMWSAMAIKGATLYLSDPASATVTALSADDGSGRWRIFTPDRVPSKTAVQWLVAFSDGVAIQLYDPESQAGELSYVGFWTDRDGTEVWSTEAVGGFVASDGASLYLSRTGRNDPCCTIDRIDTLTGTTIWSERFDGVHVDAYLSSGTLVLGEATLRTGEQFPRVDRLFGIDVETREVVWRMQMPHVSCFPIFPVADNGDIACLDISTSGLGVYRLSAASP